MKIFFLNNKLQRYKRIWMNLSSIAWSENTKFQIIIYSFKPLFMKLKTPEILYRIRTYLNAVKLNQTETQGH